MTMRTEIAERRGQVSTSQAPLWATLVATFFRVGNLRPGPGSWGSAAAAMIWFMLARWIPIGSHSAILACLIALAITLGIPAATRVARTSGTKDP